MLQHKLTEKRKKSKEIFDWLTSNEKIPMQSKQLATKLTTEIVHKTFSSSFKWKCSTFSCEYHFSLASIYSRTFEFIENENFPHSFAWNFWILIFTNSHAIHWIGFIGTWPVQWLKRQFDSLSSPLLTIHNCLGEKNAWSESVLLSKKNFPNTSNAMYISNYLLLPNITFANRNCFASYSL